MTVALHSVNREPIPVDVVGLGTVVVDHLVVLAAHPERDTKNNVLKDRFQVGGPVPTALVLLSRFGRRCRFIGSWSGDAFGQMIDADLARESVETDGSLRRADGRTGFAHVWICQRTASRTVACHRPPEGIAASELDERALRGAKMLHLDGWPREATLRAADIAKAHGTRICIDTGSPKPGITDLIRQADVLNAPHRFIVEYLGTNDERKAAETLQAMGPRIVTITRGGDGASMLHDDTWLHRPAMTIEAMDTTGAGDVFSGALIHGVLAEMDPEPLLMFALTAASLKCRQLGNREALPTLDGVRVAMAGASLIR